MYILALLDSLSLPEYSQKSAQENSLGSPQGSGNDNLCNPDIFKREILYVCSLSLWLRSYNNDSIPLRHSMKILCIILDFYKREQFIIWIIFSKEYFLP